MMRSKNTRSTLVALAVSLALTTLAFSEPAVAASSHNPVPINQYIVLTSTSGEYINMTNGSPSIAGPASGTMTLEVVNGGTSTGYLLTLKSGSVQLGTDLIPFQSGSAFMNTQETFIRGTGQTAGVTATGARAGGTFSFGAFVIGPSARGLQPLDFTVLVIHIHIGADQYLVLLQVQTFVTV